MSHRFDLVIRHGTLADGTGGELREADVGIIGGVIAAVGTLAGSGVEEIDANGCLVTPGFVDIHTHYDGQSTWDSRLLPSSWHGVTTVVMGSCGVGFAPVKLEDRSRLIELMEGVEDIPGAVLHEGLRWDWTTYGDYVDAVAKIPHDVDIGMQLAHNPLRLFVMGERAVRLERASESDITQMRVLTANAMRQGALGVTTSRTLNHQTATGAPTPGLRATPEELLGIAMGLKDAGHGVFQLISDWDTPDLETEFAMVKRIVEQSGRPLSFSIGQRHATPHVWRDLLDRTAVAVAEGLTIRAQIAPRPVGVLLGLQGSMNPFSDYPSYRSIADLSLGDRLRTMRDPAFRKKLLAEAAPEHASPIAKRVRDFGSIFVLGDPPNYEPPAEASLANMAARAGMDPAEFAYDLLVENDGQNFLFAPIANYADGNLEACREMLCDANTLIGLGDGGAHVSFICDASFPTFLLSHWGKNRAKGRLNLSYLVRRQTFDNASFIGLHDRGIVRPGYRADLNVIDMGTLMAESPRMVADLPGGGIRLLQGARGYVATIVAGVPTYRHGDATGALPGKIIRGPQPTPAFY